MAALEKLSERIEWSVFWSAAAFGEYIPEHSRPGAGLLGSRQSTLRL